MELGIKDKYALITGGSHGIGRSIALSLAEEGCHVAICARNLDRLNETVKAIEARGVKAIGVQADVLRPVDIEKVISTVIQAWGSIHILVNNVGGGGRWGSEVVEETSEEIWIDVFIVIDIIFVYTIRTDISSIF